MAHCIMKELVVDISNITWSAGPDCDRYCRQGSGRMKKQELGRVLEPFFDDRFWFQICGRTGQFCV